MKGLRALDVACEALAALLMSAMCLAVFLGVVFRYALLSPLPWVEEVARLGLVWVTFVGTYLAMRRGQHIVMDTFHDLGRAWVRWVCDAVGLAALAGFLLTLLWYGARYAAAFWASRSPYLGFPLGLVYLALPVGAALLLLAVAPALRAVGRPAAAGAPAAPGGGGQDPA